MKIENYQQYLVQRLIFTHGIEPALALRYSKILINRAIRFYLNSNFEDAVIAEDLYKEDERDGTSFFVNLTYTENEDKKALAQLAKDLEA